MYEQYIRHLERDARDGADGGLVPGSLQAKAGLFVGAISLLIGGPFFAMVSATEAQTSILKSIERNTTPQRERQTIMRPLSMMQNTAFV
ncbi:MAG: hypothetical protein ACI8UO_005807 [Verrucomicrobiales bacterium]